MPKFHFDWLSFAIGAGVMLIYVNYRIQQNPAVGAYNDVASFFGLSRVNLLAPAGRAY